MANLKGIRRHSTKPSAKKYVLRETTIQKSRRSRIASLKKTTAQGGSPYAQHPLSPGQIRLFTLESSSNPDAPIRGRLYVTSLGDTTPNYEALSYTRGPPVKGLHLDDQDIILDGHVHQVTGNLYDALRRFRLVEGERTIWIDAICINQQSLEERGAQVALMGGIFKGARRVLAWVGEEEYTPGPPFIVVCLSILDRLRLETWVKDAYGLSISDNYCLVPPASPAPEGDYRKDVFLREGSPLYCWLVERHRNVPDMLRLLQLACAHLGPDFSSFKDISQGLFFLIVSVSIEFLSRRFFRRLWIIQEIVLGQDVLLQCGSRNISWKDVDDALQWIDDNMLPLDHVQKGVLSRWPPFIARKLKAARELSVKRGIPSLATLLRYMETTSSAQCHEPLERVYILLGLLPDPPMIPDNTISEAALRTRLETLCCQQGFCSHMLYAAALEKIHYVRGHDLELVGKPSWVPNFGRITDALGWRMEVYPADRSIPAWVDDLHSLHCELYHHSTVGLVNGNLVFIAVHDGSMINTSQHPPKSPVEELASGDVTALDDIYRQIRAGDLCCRVRITGSTIESEIALREVEDHPYQRGERAPSVVQVVGWISPSSPWFQVGFDPTHRERRKFIIM